MKMKTRIAESTQSGLQLPADVTLRSRQRVQAMTEMSLLLALLFLPLLLGLMDFGRACYISLQIQNAARIAAQYGASNSTTLTDTAGMINEVKTQSPNVLASGSCSSGACWASGYPTAVYGCECSGAASGSINTTACGSCPVGQHVVDFVQVTAQANYTPWIPGIPSLVLKGQAKMRLGPP